MLTDGRPGRDLADDADAVAREIERGADADADHEHDETPGNAWREPFESEEHRQRSESDGNRRRRWRRPGS